MCAAAKGATRRPLALAGDGQACRGSASRGRRGARQGKAGLHLGVRGAGTSPPPVRSPAVFGRGAEAGSPRTGRRGGWGAGRTHLEHEPQQEDHRHTGDDVRVILQDEFVAQDWGVLGALLTERHGSASQILTDEPQLPPPGCSSQRRRRRSSGGFTSHPRASPGSGRPPRKK